MNKKNLLQFIKTKFIILYAVLFVLLFVIGCDSSISSFDRGIDEVMEVYNKHEVPLKAVPNTMEKAVLVRNDLKEIEEKSSLAPESFKLFLDYKIESIEANIVRLEAWKHGNKATVKDGFGCKALSIVVNSSKLRNYSAQKGRESLAVLQEFIDNYPEEASSLNITQRDIVFSNAYYHSVEEQAKADRRIIEYFCGNKTISK